MSVNPYRDGARRQEALRRRPASELVSVTPRAGLRARLAAKLGDIADITAALAPRPVLLNAMVNGRNELVGDTDLQREFSPAAAEYRRAGSANRLRMTAAATDPVPWLLESMTAGPNARGR